MRTPPDCEACHKPFLNAADWDDRHRDTNGSDVHAHCCGTCNARNDAEDDGSVLAICIGPPYPFNDGVLHTFNRIVGRSPDAVVAWTTNPDAAPLNANIVDYEYCDSVYLWVPDEVDPPDTNDAPPVDMDALQRQVGEWAAARWPTETMTGRGLILTEEICELDEALRALHAANGRMVRAILKRQHGERGTVEQWSAAIRKETADVGCVLLDIAHREGWSFADAVAERSADVWARDPNHDPIVP